MFVRYFNQLGYYGGKNTLMGDARTHRYDRLDELVARYRRLIRRLCWRNAAGDEAVCDDLMQECYLAIWLHLSTIRPDANRLEETAWVVWQCRGVFSHQQRRKRIETVPLDERMADTIAVGGNDGSREAIEELAACLNPRERQVLALMLGDYTDLEIAERLGMKVDSFQRMRLRMIEKMKQQIR